jgi:hypothetical protein
MCFGRQTAHPTLMAAATRAFIVSPKTQHEIQAGGCCSWTWFWISRKEPSSVIPGLLPFIRDTHILWVSSVEQWKHKIVKCLPCHCSAMHWQNSNWPVKSSCLRRSPNAQQLFTREQKLKAGPYVYSRCPELAMVLSINLHNSSEERNYY